MSQPTHQPVLQFLGTATHTERDVTLALFDFSGCLMLSPPGIDPEIASFSELPQCIKVRSGLYRHFKGTVYIIFGVARLAGTTQLFVVYRENNNQSRIFARPYGSFISDAKDPITEQTVRRFTPMFRPRH